MLVYHGGDFSALRVLRKLGARPGLYVFLNEGNAEGHAEANYGEGEHGTPAVVEVKVSRSWLEADPEYKGYDDIAFIVTKSLSPEAFGPVYSWESDRWAGG